MHDIRSIRDNADAFVAGLERRGGSEWGALVLDLRKTDEELRTLLTELQARQARRNEASKLIGQAKAKKDEAGAAALMAEVAGLKDAIQQGEQRQRTLEAELKAKLAVLPNIPADDVPQGAGEDDNVPVAARAFAGKPRSNLTKDHVELGEALGMMDFERAARISGARFFYLKGPIARLERALASFMLDIHTGRFGYEEMVVPFLVRDNAMFGTGQLPKFEDDLFQTFKAEERDERYWLVPTSEVPLTNYVHGEILDEAALPLRLTAYTPCFRAEAGAAGRDTRGMIRTHQFSKVELVSICAPEKSEEEHERMTDAAQAVLKGLDLPHRVVTLCTGDMGFAARKTYDIEVWLPGQGKFREISSCSNCGEFQARRMNTRYRGADGKVKGMVHTLNGSGVAFSRLIPAILENYQNPDGSIAIPDALQPYMGGLEKIERK
ncbi:MAG: serine--tRNA ligase [Rhizomicrobium sp.]